jgi:hypothetical protein
MNEDKELLNVPWEREFLWLRFQEELKQLLTASGLRSGLSDEAVLDRCRKAFDACFFESSKIDENFLAFIKLHVTKMIACVFAREIYVLKLEAALREFGVEVQTPRWDV